MTILLSPETVAPFAEKVPVPLLVGLLGLVDVIVTAAVSAVSGRWAQATNCRRDAYAAAVKSLVAWAEYSYRIRRRTSDDPDELTRLGRGHLPRGRDGDHYNGPACNDAWAAEPITAAPG